MKTPVLLFTRREVLGALAAMTVAAPGPTAKGTYSYRFFTLAEARFIETACDRFIPADESGTGAVAAGVPRFLDHHLAGAWGSGQQPYRGGAWQPGSPWGVQCVGRSPASVFRAALAAHPADLAVWTAAQCLPLTRLDLMATTHRDAYLDRLAQGAADLGEISSAVFFQMLLSMAVEGFFSGGTAARGAIRWPMRGFPGALATSA